MMLHVHGASYRVYVFTAVKPYLMLKAWGQCSAVALLLITTQSCSTAPQPIIVPYYWQCQKLKPNFSCVF